MHDDMRRIREELLRLPGFGGLSDKELTQLLRHLDEVVLPKGWVLTEEGRPSTECFLLLQGQAAVLVCGTRVATAGPGEFVGEMGMLTNRPRTATVVAESDMRALVAGKKDFFAVLDTGTVRSHVLAAMTHRLVRVQEAVCGGGGERVGALDAVGAGDPVAGGS